MSTIITKPTALHALRDTVRRPVETYTRPKTNKHDCLFYYSNLPRSGIEPAIASVKARNTTAEPCSRVTIIYNNFGLF